MKLVWNWNVHVERDRFKCAWSKGSNNIIRSQPFSICWFRYPLCQLNFQSLQPFLPPRLFWLLSLFISLPVLNFIWMGSYSIYLICTSFTYVIVVRVIHFVIHGCSSFILMPFVIDMNVPQYTIYLLLLL